jgi:hypothetical protein
VDLSLVVLALVVTELRLGLQEAVQVQSLHYL